MGRVQLKDKVLIKPQKRFQLLDWLNLTNKRKKDTGVDETNGRAGKHTWEPG